MKNNSERPRPDLVYDESGVLVGEIFYQFGAHYSRDSLSNPGDNSWYFSERRSDDDGIFYCEALPLFDEKHPIAQGNPYDRTYGCKASREHVTQEYLAPLYVDVHLGGEQTEFVPSTGFDEIIVVDAFRKQVEASELRGVSFESVPQEFDKNDRNAPPPPMSVMRFRGNVFERPRRLLGKPNHCPNCGQGSLVCSTCGKRMHVCVHCKKHVLTLHRSPPEKIEGQLIVEDCPRDGAVLIGDTWDGSDFCLHLGLRFITKRALWWLQMVHARQFYARPARVCVDGMSEEQLAWLKRAQDPTSLGK